MASAALVVEALVEVEPEEAGKLKASEAIEAVEAVEG